MQPAASGRTLGGRYRLVEPLARGGMASVWVGEDTLLARRVAVKILHSELSGDASLRARFRNEAISSASIEDPSIVAVYDAGDDDGVAYIVMELVEGQDLRHLLDERGPLAPSIATRLARDVALALDRAHRNGIVHRDIKPANVLVAADGRVKVTDFGIAKASRSDGDLTSTGAILGTTRYLAPEQVRGERADARADVYATGLLLYEMLTGRLPFRGDSDMATAMARLSTTPDPLPSSVPSAVASIVDRCLAFDPASRYPSARALADALDRAAGGDLTTPNEVTGVLTPPVPPPRAASRPAQPAPSRRRPRVGAWLAGLLLVAAIAGAATAGYLLLGIDDRGGSGPGGSVPPTALHLVAAKDFDPLGNDGQESPRLVGLAIDGNPITAWQTERYATRDFGRAKAGVGIYVTLAAAADVSAVSVDTFEASWNAQIYVADAPPSTLAGWGRPVASGSALGKQARFAINPATHTRYVLLWLTLLPPSGLLHVAEIRVS